MQTMPDPQETWDGSTGGARTESEAYDLTQIPFEALKRVGAIFCEGDRKYGNRRYSADNRTVVLGNWHHGVNNKAYQLERANHAVKHLYTYIHWLETGEYLGEPHAGGHTKLLNVSTKISPDGLLAIETEDDLAKVMWFCATQMELERLEWKE